MRKKKNLCLTDGCIYTIEIKTKSAICTVQIPKTVNLIETKELKERIHRGMEWALAPYFIGKFIK